MGNNEKRDEIEGNEMDGGGKEWELSQDREN